MQLRLARPRAISFWPLLSLLAASPDAQAGPGAAPDDELFRTIASLDRAVFDAYNACDLDTFAAFFTEDLEFYHDQTGLMRSRRSLVEAVRNNICGKVRRELVPGTLQVHPMQGYGAVEIGVHRFHHPGNAEPIGEAGFLHLWQSTDGAWKMTRVVSYDHHVLAPAAAQGQRGPETVIDPGPPAVKAVEATLQSWSEGWRTKDAQLACSDYADDADWTNAFGMTERGREAICRRLTEVFALPFVTAATSDVVSQDVRFLGPDVAVVVTKVRREGQKTPAGEALGPRDTRHQRVLSRAGGKWRIVSHLIADARDPASTRH